MSARAPVAALLLLVTGCSERCGSSKGAAEIEPPRLEAAAGRWFRVVVKADPYEVPFFLWLPPPGSKEPALIANGEERISVQHRWRGDRSELSFPVFHAILDSRISKSGKLRGEWEMGHLGNTSFRVAGEAIDDPEPALRFETTSTAAADIGGVWRFQSERFGIGKGIFRQQPEGVVTGTVLLEKVGDMRFMAGAMNGRELLLSTFDGQHAFLLRAELKSDGRMSGIFVWPGLWEEEFTMERAEEVTIDFLHHAKMKPGKDRITLPQLEKHAGKAVLVDIFGTWCPACMDMTPFLSELEEKYGPQGLEIVGLAIELTSDAAYAEEQVRRFEEKYSVDWDVSVILGESDSVGDLLPPELTDVSGLPLSIFIRRDGTVHALHTGFAGPATGEDHVRARERFEGLVKEIVASKTR